jgi:hypothetical protein
MTDVKHGVGLVDPYTSLLLADCPGCLYAQHRQGGLLWTESVENKLYLNVSVGSQPESLELNGVQFYPPVLSLISKPDSPYIAQVPAELTLKDIREKPELVGQPLRLTGWGFSAESAQTVNESGEEVLTIHLQLDALEQQPIHIPMLIITVLKNTDGQLMILNVEQSSPQSAAEECKNWPLLCKWRAIVAANLQSMRGKVRGKCSKRPHAGMGIAEHKNGRHGHHRGQRPHHHHHSHGQNRHQFPGAAIRKIILTIVIPILVGILAGMLTYLLAIAIGAVAAFVVVRLRGRQAYTPVALDEEAPAYDEGLTKQDFLDAEVADFESLPVYVEVEANEVVVPK